MKKNILNLMAIVAFVIGAISCEKNEGTEEVKISSADVAAIKTVMISGDWYISNYFDSQNELTTEYAEFTFGFNENGTITATDGDSSLSGAWLVKSQSDDEKNTVDFELHFASPEKFKKLSQDWQVMKYTDSQIDLTYIDDDDVDGTRLLSFKK
ncbi:hypothetical protein GH721_17230 [Kriegella sp. EG-1]|nr:hypothetical protein [Flavobacteriaceae bacterium EG-1]